MTRRARAGRRRTLVVLEDPARWNLQVDGVEAVAAQDYLTDPGIAAPGHRVFNLCASTWHQSLGYYVSLLAEARGHRALPTLATIQDLRQGLLPASFGRDLDAVIQRALAPLKSDEFELSIYFGANLAKRYLPLARALFDRFPAPLLRATFRRGPRGWRLERVRDLALEDVPKNHAGFLEERAAAYLERPRRAPRRRAPRFELAMLVDPDEPNPPSNPGALQRFERAGADLGIRVQRLERADAARVPQFDALFLRQTTAVNHVTYRIARRAAQEGLVVVDDPESILRCTNKVYLAEVFERLGISAPRTLVIHQGNRDQVADTLGLPCVIKRPDSSFSLGVHKAGTQDELDRVLDTAFEGSALLVGQEFARSNFDWRIGVLGGEPLYACKYHLAPGHFTIQAKGPRGGTVYGETETLPIEAAPQDAVALAVAAAAPIGDGLYGVDIKEVGDRFLVMEVNDNPNLEVGVEDLVLGKDLYRRIMQYFLARLEARTGW